MTDVARKNDEAISTHKNLSIDRHSASWRIATSYLCIHLFKNLIIGLFVYLFIGLFTASAAHADFELGVYPPVTTITTIVPNTVHATITFTNAGDTPITGDVKMVPFKASDTQNGMPAYLTTFQGTDAQIAQKITVTYGNDPVTTLTIPPQSKRDLTLTITLPEDEPDGDYYFSVILSSKGDTSDQSTSSSITTSIASHVLLSIGMNHKPVGTIDSFTTPVFVTSGPLPITIVVANTGTSFFAPQSTITITNMFGQTVGAIPLLPVNILAKSKRSLPSAESSNTTEQTGPVWHEKALFGIYTVKAQVALSSQGPLFTQTRTVIAIPWYAIGSISIVSLLTLFIVTRITKRIK